MKVLQINSGHYRRGGADVVYLNTTDLLRDKGHEVICFSMEDPKNIPTPESKWFVSGTDIRTASTLRKIKSAPAFIYNKEAAKKLDSLLQTFKPDIAHIHLYLGKLSSSILPVLKKHGVPVVFSVHDYRFICPAYLFLDGKNQICERCKSGSLLNCTIHKCSEGNRMQSLLLTADAYYRRYKMSPVKQAAAFIFVSQFIRNKHREFDQRYEDKAHTLYNFIPSLEKISPLHTKGSYFLFYGRLSREKGVDTLIQAAKNAGIPLVVAGTGSLSDKYKDHSDPNIQFVGHKTGAELWELVKNASFVIVPSEWYENNPLTVLESYGLGKPVIGARIGGIPEIVIPGETGYLFEPGNIVELTEVLLKANKISDDEYLELSVQARRFANKNFEPDQHYQKLLSIYKNTIKEFENL